MDKDEYREEVLKQLKELNLNTEVIGIFSIIANIFLFFIMLIVAFK